jgi:hypothetical protein
MHALARAIKSGKVLVKLSNNFTGEFLLKIGGEQVVFEPNKPIDLYLKFTGGELINCEALTEALSLGTLQLL